jgi:hypothetical protein
LEEEEETEYDEYGRKFAIMKPIIWHKQFRARDGDPGLNMFKLAERFLRAIVPKILADIKFEGSLVGMGIKGVFVDKLAHPSEVSHGLHKVAHKMKTAVKDKVTSAKEHAKVTEKKISNKVHRGGTPEGTHYEPAGVPGLSAQDQRALQSRQEEHLIAVSGGQSLSWVPAPATARAQIPVVVTENPSVPTSGIVAASGPVASPEAKRMTTTTTVDTAPTQTFVATAPAPPQFVSVEVPVQQQMPVTGQVTRTSWTSNISTFPSTSVAPAPLPGGPADVTKSEVVEGVDIVNRPPVSS